ncbi:hypothetical protein ACS0TY_028263 [Phlomoides rotata]
MHRVPKFFVHSSNRRQGDARSGDGDGEGSTSNRRKLDRRNARKNINYEYSPSSASASSSSSYYSSEESLRTRSLDLYGGRTSFRIEGIDGEIEILCKNLGFSGIDDLSISPEDYEAMKVRSSSAPVMFSQIYEDANYDAGSINPLNRIIEGDDKFVRNSNNSSDDTRDNFEMNRSRANVIDSRFVDLSENVRGRSNELRGSGIKGVRPPVLAPPPSMSLPVIDKECSTWDMFRAFGPDNNTGISRCERPFPLDENEEDGRNRNGDENQEDGRRREENCALSGSCSFTTNSNDDDCSSSTTDPMSSISPNVRYKRVISAWQKGGLLGSGSFGSVYEGIADDGFFFAVKEVSLLHQGNEGKQQIMQLEHEIDILRQFQHENIVQYYGTAKDESHLYIFLELVNQGSLLSLYRRYTLRDPVVSGYTRQILHGLKYLHDRNMMHRDIKCANILVDTNGSVKLADFGLAKATKLNDVKSCKGTAFWMAPEVVKSQGYGLAADIWSLGCTVLEMLTRNFPYHNLECVSKSTLVI